MSFRFLFWTAVILLVFSGTAGWFFHGDREEDPNVLQLRAYKVQLDSERLAAEKGGAPDWTRYADSLRDAPETLRDVKEAMRWFRKAADEGYAPAQVAIGKMYETGLGVQPDYHRAHEWYVLATRLSRNPEAYFKVAEGYFRGRGVAQDYGAALPYYRTAANQGHPVAQYIIGSMYEAGWGVERDLIEAWLWYHRALPKADQVRRHAEDYNVAEAIERVERHMNKSQIDAARKRLSESAG